VSAQSDHLTENEVAQVLDLVHEADAIVVGGQSMAIWARIYAGYNPEIPKIYTMSSEDVDFFGSRKAAETFAAKLGNGKIYIPGIDDHTPNSAYVVGLIGNREIKVDFLHSVLGVPSALLENNVVTLTGHRADTGGELAIRVLHPLDCFRSRLSNINDLKRKGLHSISSARASILVLDAFINHMLAIGKVKAAQETLQDLRYVTLQKCFGTVAHLEFGLDPRWVFEKYILDERFDSRFRNFQITASPARLDEKVAQVEIAVAKAHQCDTTL
jgi:hypothetical protein